MVEKYNGKRIGSEDEKLTGLPSKVQDTVEESSERYVPYMC
jgi:tyrosine-protein phosphatase non-receptor type 2